MSSMHTARRVRQFVAQDRWTMDLDAIPRIQRLALHAWRWVIAVAVVFRFRLLDARAAGLVYTTLLSLVPFLAAMFSVLKAFEWHQHIAPLSNHVFEPLGPKGAEAGSHMIWFVDNLKVGVLGTVGVAGPFSETYSLIDKIEQGRTWARKFTDDLSVVLVGPVLIFTAVGLLASVQRHALIDRVRDVQPFGILLIWTAELMPFVLPCALFTVICKFVSTTLVTVRAARLWGLAGEAFATFVAVSGKYRAIYSRFAVLLLFLLWLYVSWMIILLDQGLLARMNEPEGIGLVTPPELMAFADVLSLIHKGQGANLGSSHTPGEPIDALLRRRDAAVAVAESLEGMTLHSLIVGDHEKAATPGTPVRTWQDAEKVRQRRSRITQRLNESCSEIGNTGGVFPFAKIYCTGERPHEV
ncbi:MAG: YihY/virulence factor BrkB family protein, partial [Nitrospirota bacterium]|nr:YihY/virulence factor BrkB family protein [Nitrospirota bacterium]